MGWMNSSANRKVKLYLQGLYSPCMDDQLVYDYTLYDFGWINRDFKRISIYKNFKEFGISDSRALKNKLTWLMKEGHRADFKERHSYLSALSEPDRTNFLQSLSRENREHAKWYMVNYYLKKLSGDGIAAYDYAWYIYLCRAGLAEGYLNNIEAQTFILKAAKLAQQSYSGWESYVTAYVCGSQFASSDDTFEFTKKNHAYLSKLFAARRSPLRQVDWHVPL